jgi:hypothetical protein
MERQNYTGVRPEDPVRLRWGTRKPVALEGCMRRMTDDTAWSLGHYRERQAEEGQRLKKPEQQDHKPKQVVRNISHGHRINEQRTAVTVEKAFWSVDGSKPANRQNAYVCG